MSRLLLTRPKGEDDALAQGLRNLGHQVIQMPLLRISPLTISPCTISSHNLQGLSLWNMEGLDIQDWFFASVNAVRYCPPHVWPYVKRAFTAGPATAAALQAKGIGSVIQPPEGLGVTALLKMPRFFDRYASDQRFGIVRGTEGSDQLEQAFVEKGISVVNVVCYTQEGVDYSRESLEGLFREPFDALMLSSGMAARHLKTLCVSMPLGANIWAALKKSQIFVPNAERLHQWLTEEGFERVTLLNSLSDVDSIQAYLT